MRLPHPGDPVVVLWLDTVDHNEWQDVDEAKKLVKDHDAIECQGRWIGKTKDGYIHIGNQSSMLGGKISTFGFKSDILLKSVISITVLPTGIGEVVYALGSKGRTKTHKESEQPKETATVEGREQLGPQENRG